jgi:hypothetical protein
MPCPSRQQWQKGKVRNHASPSEEGRFGWQANDAALVIRRHFTDSGTKGLASTLALYSTLIDNASRENSEEFIISHRELSLRSGMSRPQVKKVLDILLELGLVAWKQNFADAGLRDQTSNTYRLLSLKGNNGNTPP